ncbi:MAG: SGNH/GDSL hydrolase family protein [Dermatophilaceae bacterium]
MTFASHRLSAAILAASLTASGLTAVALAGPAAADGPGSGTPWVATLGDSYMSGEAGRWAGSSNASSSYADALGSTAYFDNASNTGEQIARCHRSKAQESSIGGGVNGLNLACSGAKTSTYTSSDGYFKPGLDFSDNGAGQQGQAKMLQTFAAAHNVKMVVVGIGGNDFSFASIVQSCVTDFLGSPSWFPDYCNDDSSVKANFTAANISAVQAKVATGLWNVRTAMRRAGYADSTWSMVVQTYPSPIPNGAGFRYSQSGYTRQSTGGCGFWNKDADWANSTALPTINATVRNAITASGVAGVKTLELASAFNGRRLCENTVGLYEEKGLTSWQQTGAVDQTEWVNQIRTVSTAGSNYYIQESLHPNYWAQMGLRSCVRQVWNGGAVRGGACTISGTGLVGGEPRMALS